MIIAAGQTAGEFPSVDLLVDSLPVGTYSITIWRTYGGNRDVVRDANAAPTNGAVSRPYTDAEVPFSVPVIYTAYALSEAGAQLAVAAAAPVTVETDKAWISDPLAPGRATPVALSGSTGEGRLINDSLQTIEHTTPGSIEDILESALPMASMGVTQAGSFTLLFAAPTALIGAKYRLVLQSANPFLLRLPPSANFQIPALCYVAHTSYSDIKVYREHDHIQVTGVAVQPPPSPVVLPSRTYADVRDEANSYADLPELFPSYLAMLRG